MKRTFYILLFTFVISPLMAQEAGDILNNTQQAYREINNIVVEGRYEFHLHYVNTNLIANTLAKATFKLAMDKEGNIAHWFKNDGKATGASFYQTQNDSLGLYTRIGTSDPSLTCSRGEAGARLIPSGGGVMYLLGSMFYKHFNLNTDQDSSHMLYYDKAQLMPDSLIDGEACFVVTTNRTIMITEEMANAANHRMDSINGLLELPMEQRGGPRKTAGPVFMGAKYWIRKTDYMILRYENYQYEEDGIGIKNKNIISMKSKYNVSDFKKYME